MPQPGGVQLVVSSDAVDVALARLADHLESAGLAPQRLGIAMVVADEMLTNVVRCAWPFGGTHEFHLLVRLEPPILHLLLEDDGIAFDPTKAPAPDLTLALEDRPIGSLGLHLVRALSRSMSYARQDGRNRLEVSLDTTP
jgi:anti-sigma regulatory factor (Ser/Thr protein kinase)